LKHPGNAEDRTSHSLKNVQTPIPKQTETRLCCLSCHSSKAVRSCSAVPRISTTIVTYSLTRGEGCFTARRAIGFTVLGLLPRLDLSSSDPSARPGLAWPGPWAGPGSCSFPLPSPASVTDSEFRLVGEEFVVRPGLLLTAGVSSVDGDCTPFAISLISCWGQIYFTHLPKISVQCSTF
jgi:hypothetical protein